ncbi:hypothetical protein FHS99_001808 [Sphingomonas prati]|uniref:Uncharacterized protein n=1 Tax=Sphingomonas prati TaxID=1843237 RepID=A0A7W9BTI6_9SPHN|nr:hypothetical protein [Sphingomonas prati]
MFAQHEAIISAAYCVDYESLPQLTRRRDRTFK